MERRESAAPGVGVEVCRHSADVAVPVRDENAREGHRGEA